MVAPSAHKWALACGSGGSFVEVTNDVVLDSNITRSWGRKDEFSDTPPGTFSFILDNRDGKYTPGNTASSLSVKVTEGMEVCWQLGSRLVSGRIKSIDPYFKGLVADIARVKITCTDMLGAAARAKLLGSTLTEAVVLGASPYLFWPMSDAEGSTEIAEQSGNKQPSLQRTPGASASTLPTFGVTGVPGVGGTQASFASSNMISAALSNNGAPVYNTPYPANTLGYWGFWFTPTSSPTSFNLYWAYQYPFSFFTMTCTSLASGMVFSTGGATTPTVTISSPALALNVPHYFSLKMDLTSGFAASLYMDGVQVGSTGTGSLDGRISTLPHNLAAVQLYTTGAGTFNIQNLSHTLAPANEFAVAGLDVSTEAGWLTALAQMSGNSVVLDTLPTGLSTAPIGAVTWAGQSHLALMNDVITTEQGHIYPVTTGSLTAPVQKVKVRARTRPAAVTYTFAATEIINAPELVRDITNMVSTVTVSGIGSTQTVSDTALTAQVANASASENVLFTNSVDVISWGQDRLNRGKASLVRIAAFQIDGQGTATDRWADLAAIVPGDRIQITGLPSTQLGFSTWDAWFLGADESHSTEKNVFTFYVSPTLPDVPLYDTALFMSGGNHYLSTSMNSSVTSMSIGRFTGSPLYSTADVPYTVIVENEQMRVTAMTSANPQVATVTRGYGGTTAAGHTTLGVAVEIVPDTLYGF